jgi:photosystem II stability/assembly factor-like uncharacterized protein
MRQALTVTLVGLLLTLRCLAQWEVINPDPGAPPANQILMVTANTGFAVGQEGAILKTTNGGNHWILLPSVTANSLNGLFFIDSLAGFIVGDLGTILKTTDGGLSWVILHCGIQARLRSVFFYDLMTGVAVGDSSAILRTTDGGNTWAFIHTAYTGNYYSVCSNLADTLYMSGNYLVSGDSRGGIFCSTDHGQTWVASLCAVLGITITHVQFPSGLSGFAVTNKKEIYKYVFSSGYWHWSSRQVAGFAFSLNGGYFPTPQTGFVFGNDGVMFKSVNGGEGWTEISLSSHINLLSGWFSDENNGFLTGDSSAILKTADGGQSFDPVTGIYAKVEGINFFSGKTGLAVDREYGDGWHTFHYSRIYRTENAGEDWTQEDVFLNIGIQEMDFPTPDTGYLTGFSLMYGWLFRTVNGGLNWQIATSSPPIGDQFGYLCFPSGHCGYSGLWFNLARTTDAGETWQIVWTDSTNYIKAFSFCDDDNGILATTGGVYHTTDGGASWDLAYATSNASAVYSMTPERLFVAEPPGMIAMSIDGGTTWNNVNTGVDFKINDIRFTDVENGYAVGGWGVIMKTIDGGTTWDQLTSPVSTELYKICFPNPDTGYIRGEDNLILRTFNSGGWPVGMNERSNAQPESLLFHPNPAKDLVTVRTTTCGQLSVMNLQGKELLQYTISETFTRIDIKILPPGIYFVTLTGNSSTQTGKFIKE